MKLTMQKSWIFSTMSVWSLLPFAKSAISDHHHDDEHGNLRHVAVASGSIHELAASGTNEQDFAGAMRSMMQVDREDIEVTCPDPTIGSFENPVFSCLSGVNCVAGDMDFLSCKLVPASGGSGCVSCDCGETVPMKIQCVVKNENNSDRGVAWVLGKLSQTPQGQCGSGSQQTCDLGLCADGLVLPKNVPKTVTFDTEIEWVCGSSISLTNVALGGQPTNRACDATTFDGNCNVFSPKCRKVDAQTINAPLVVSTPTVECVEGKTRDQIVTYTVSGGTSPYAVTIKCSDPAAEYTPATGEYTQQIDYCDGTVTVTVKDGSGCEVQRSTDETPRCCFNDFTCKPRSEDITQYSGCSAADDGNALLDFDEVYQVNEEACMTDPDLDDFSFTHDEEITSGDSVCSDEGGLTITRTYYTTPRDYSGNDDPQPDCTDSWKVVDDIDPYFTGACAGKLDDKVIGCGDTTVPATTTCTASDSCGGTVAISETCCFQDGKLVHTHTATDTCGNSVSTTENVVLGVGAGSACSA